MNQQSKTGPLIIIGSLFFILGFITWLNGILIPYLKTACELTDFQALFVAFAFYISYTVMALPASWILKKTGFKNGMSIGLWVMAVGALVFIPAAATRIYSFFLVGLFILGTGMSILQTAVNPYITILGPIESAAKRISMMGIANKLAGAIAPLVLAYFVVQQGDDEAIKNLVNLSAEDKSIFLDGLAARVVNPYIVMAIVLFIVGLGLKFSNLPEVDSEGNDDINDSTQEDKSSVFAYPYLVLGVFTLFFYVGAEVIAGDTIIQYGKSLGISMESAKMFTTYTMVSMLVGYVLGILFIPKYISQHRALQASAVLGIVFTTVALFTDGFVSVLFIALLGFANALVWPAIWPLAIKGLGRHIKTGSAMLIMAISGGAILPLAWGKMSDLYGSQTAYFVMIPCYLVILFFSTYGYKIKKW
ncbi:MULTISPECIES: sugar MFS transporter [unclassified Lentimicrobium]|uniref:sugar MFS transporter n=1 Tax=unclassified Lentimicrobium TaxID=2677434 RepID=UPI0015544E8D|nr:MULTISPECIES: sugar MFS transporter [unclassified Lentimicrobium]NPD46691.1 sugar MFS transporter [Lentimicrobium sp. S6]NPD85533.1 sugar MFS transporter [Lentimicrobium sp. L6]